MLIAENLHKTYETKDWTGFLKREKREVKAVRGVNLELKEGQIIGLLGINGAGKTTTIKMLSTLLQPTSGQVIVDGLDAVKQSMAVKKKINMITGGERMIYWRLTARENLWYYGQLYDVEKSVLNSRIDMLLDRVGLSEKKDIPVERFSKGMKQRLQIARGLINDPSYIFMDEPTLGLDAAIAKELREYVRDMAAESGKAILLTTHYLQEVEELCEYVYVLNEGQVIAKGTPKELAFMEEDDRVTCLELNESNPVFHEALLKHCNAPEYSCKVEQDSGKKNYKITASMDMNRDIASLLMSHQVSFKSFYQQEPTLENAIIKMARRV